MAIKLKNKIERLCTICSIVAGIIGLALLTQAGYQWFTEHFADTIKLMMKLF